MAITAMSLTNGTLTVILDNGNEILTARNDHPKWERIVDAFKASNENDLISLLSLKSCVEAFSVGQLSVNSTGVTFRGQPMHTVDSARVMAFLRDGLPYKPLANYMARKMANPSARAISELYNFLEHKNMPITPEGKIIAYKGVQPNFYSVRGNKQTIVVQGEVNSEGQILNAVNSTIEVERSSVDDDFRNGCSFGIHAGSLSYAKGWGKRVVLVEIDPADVVSVPEDCNCQKLRCCKYKVIGEYTGPMPETFTDEFDAQSNDEDQYDGEEEESECDDCGGDSTDGCGCEDYTMETDPSTEDFKDAVASKCLQILRDHVSTPNDITENCALWTLGMDDIDRIQVGMALEEEFNVEIYDPTMENILTTQNFSDLVKYIYSLMGVTPNTAPSETVLSPSAEREIRYADGFTKGNTDACEGNSQKYLSGDQDAADSDLHRAYIDGYINGWISGMSPL